MAKKEKSGLTAEEISVFCEQISLMLGSDIPLIEGIEALCEDYRGTRGAKALEVMRDEMHESGSLACAVAKAGVFPEYMTGMVRVGEDAGQLDRVMQGLAAYYLREAQLRRTAANAVRYPLTLIAVMALVVLVLVLRVLPIFDQALRSLGGDLPGYSLSMMRVGQAAGVGVFVVMVLILVCALVIYGLTRNGRHPELRRRLLMRIPALGRLQRLRTAQRFSAVLSMLLASGFPLEQALELIPSVFEGEDERTLMQKVCDRVLDGATVYDAVAETHLFDTLHLRMLRVGFTSGQADTAFAKVAQLEAEEIEEATGRLISLIEPLLVVVLSVMIGAILLAVMMPLAGVLSAMA